MATKEREARIKQMRDNRLEGVIVVLEDIIDPHNAAAILRTCDGLGIGEVWYLFDREEPYDPKKIGKASSSTANKWVKTRVFDNRDQIFKKLKAQGYDSVATTIHELGIEKLWQSDFSSGKISLWLVNERRGLSEETVDQCDRRLTIPMRGMVESFNVSVTAAIILAEIARQRIN